jgi:hypothetical protein
MTDHLSPPKIIKPHSFLLALLKFAWVISLHEQTGRLFLCARCQAKVLVCSQCGRGHLPIAPSPRQRPARSGHLKSAATHIGVETASVE